MQTNPAVEGTKTFNRNVIVGANELVSCIMYCIFCWPRPRGKIQL